MRAAIMQSGSVIKQPFSVASGLINASNATGLSPQVIENISNQLIAQGGNPDTTAGLVHGMIAGGIGGMTPVAAQGMLSALSPYIYDPNKQYGTILGNMVTGATQPGSQNVLKDIAGQSTDQTLMYAAMSGDFEGAMAQRQQGNFLGIATGMQAMAGNFTDDWQGELAMGMLNNPAEYQNVKNLNVNQLAANLAAAAGPNAQATSKLQTAIDAGRKSVVGANNNPWTRFLHIASANDTIGSEQNAELNAVAQQLKNQGTTTLSQDDLNQIQSQIGISSNASLSGYDPMINKILNNNGITVSINKNGSVDATSQSPFNKVTQVNSTATSRVLNDLRKL
jgi:hypothetical protein